MTYYGALAREGDGEPPPVSFSLFFHTAAPCEPSTLNIAAQERGATSVHTNLLTHLSAFNGFGLAVPHGGVLQNEILVL